MILAWLGLDRSKISSNAKFEIERDCLTSLSLNLLSLLFSNLTTEESSLDRKILNLELLEKLENTPNADRDRL